MDDQNQPMNQPNDPTKKDQGDVTSSAPVEMEPETQPSVTPPTVQAAGSVTSQPAAQPQTKASNPMPAASPVAPTEPMLEAPEPTPAVPSPAQPEGLLDQPKKRSGAFIAIIIVVLIIALAALGYIAYKLIY